MLYLSSARLFPPIFAIACSLFIHSAEGGRLLDLFKNDLQRIPNSENLLQQEKQARAELENALKHESQGNTGQALSIHKAIVRDYPLSSAASTSQFKIGALYNSQDKPEKAFDAFQKFIENYTGNPAFSDALRYQYEIAKAGQKGKFKKMILGVIPRKTQVSDLLKWHGKIIDNAPHSEYAPLSQFSIAEIYQSEKKTSMAIGAYQALVDKYPNHPKSSEAQFRIGSISTSEINRGSQDHGNITSARDAMEDVIVAYQDSERAEQARKALAQFDLIEAGRFYEIGRFYENQKQYRSAVVYYQKVLSFPGSKHIGDSKQRHAALLLKISPTKTNDAQSEASPAKQTISKKLRSVTQKLKIRPDKEPIVNTPPGSQTSDPNPSNPQS
jgi:outer membrane assembly lipoprotein YfiO